MAEVATGRSWQQLFRDRLTAPLGLPADVRFYALPNTALGPQNPLAAGGLRASAHEYGRLLALVFHKGRLGSVAVGTPALFDAQAREPYPAVVIGSSPALRAGWGFRYGLGAWLQCATPASGCAEISSPGAFGFVPWLDRDAGYYATIAMEEVAGSGATVGTTLAQQLAPLIRQALVAP
jgi:CubicO group peptidase (beta-lactamase class C family)